MRRAFAAVVALLLLGAPGWAGSMETTQANIHFNLALRQYQSQKLDDAKGSLAKALGLVPQHPQANLLLGLIDCQQSHFSDAIAPLKIASAGLPNDPDPWNNLGVAYFQLGKLDEAADAFQHVLALKPDSPDTAMNLGVLQLRQKHYQDSEKAFAMAVKADSNNAKAWLGLAEAADGTGDAGASIQARLRAMALEPADRSLRQELGQRLYQAGRLTEAAATLAPLQDKGESGVEFLLGVLAYRRGDFDGSRQRFEAALVDRPDYPEARYNLAITDYDQGLFVEALSQFQAVLAKHPDDGDARRDLEVTRQAAVRAWLKQGSEDFLKADYVAALQQWRKALDLDKENKVVKDLVETAGAQLKLQAEDLATSGKQDWDAGKKEDAIQSWAQALERDPGNAVAKLGLDGAKDEVSRLAKAYELQARSDLAEGRLDRAREQAIKVLSLDKAAGKALNALVEQDCRRRFDKATQDALDTASKGALGQAVDAWQRALDAEPDDSPTQLKLNQAKVGLRQALDEGMVAAQAADKAGRVEEAVKLYRRVLEWQPSQPVAKEALKRLAAHSAVRGLDPAQLEDLYYQGVYAYAAGETDKAESFWKKVIEIDPKHQLAREALDRSQRRKRALKRQ